MDKIRFQELEAGLRRFRQEEVKLDTMRRQAKREGKPLPMDDRTKRLMARFAEFQQKEKRRLEQKKRVEAQMAERKVERDRRIAAGENIWDVTYDLLRLTKFHNPYAAIQGETEHDRKIAYMRACNRKYEAMARARKNRITDTYINKAKEDFGENLHLRTAFHIPSESVEGATATRTAGPKSSPKDSGDSQVVFHKVNRVNNLSASPESSPKTTDSGNSRRLNKSRTNLAARPESSHISEHIHIDSGIPRKKAGSASVHKSIPADPESSHLHNDSGVPSSQTVGEISSNDFSTTANPESMLNANAGVTPNSISDGQAAGRPEGLSRKPRPRIRIAQRVCYVERDEKGELRVRYPERERQRMLAKKRPKRDNENNV